MPTISGSAGGYRVLALEALGRRPLGCGEHGGALSLHGGSLAEVHRRRRHVTDAGVVMPVVVPDEEATQVSTRVLYAVEARGEVRPVLERLELRLRERIIVGNPRPRERRRHPEIDERFRGGLGAHWAAAIRIQRKGVARDAVFLAGLLDERAGEPRVLGASHQPPTPHVAVEDIDEHVEVEVLPLQRASQPRDVPAPHRVRRGGHELGLRVHELIAPLVYQPGGVEHPVVSSKVRTEAR